MNHTISVVIPVYGRQHLLQRAVDSVLAQTLLPSEIVIVDDGSTPRIDWPRDSVDSGAVSIRFVHHAENRGAQVARNTGIEASVGKWIAFLDADDYWLPHKLRVQIQQVNEWLRCFGVPPSCVLANGRMLTTAGEMRLLVRRPVPHLACSEVLRGGVALFPALLAQRKALNSIGGLDTSLAGFHEWDTVIRLCSTGPALYVDEPCFVWDRTNGSTISTGAIADVHGFLQVLQKNALKYAGEFGRTKYLSALLWNIRRRARELTFEELLHTLRMSVRAAWSLHAVPPQSLAAS